MESDQPNKGSFENAEEDESSQEMDDGEVIKPIHSQSTSSTCEEQRVLPSLEYHDHAAMTELDLDKLVYAKIGSTGSRKIQEDISDGQRRDSPGLDTSGSKKRKHNSSGPRGGVYEPFPLKLHRMLATVEQLGLSQAVAWKHHGRAFQVNQVNQFVQSILPKFFRQTKLTSFQRQLNLYGFRRIIHGPDSGAYYHEFFLRGKPYLCRAMVRTKVKGMSRLKACDIAGNEPDFNKMPPLPELTKDDLQKFQDMSERSLQEKGERDQARTVVKRHKNDEKRTSFDVVANFGNSSSMIPPTTSPNQYPPPPSYGPYSDRPDMHQYPDNNNSMPPFPIYSQNYTHNSHWGKPQPEPAYSQSYYYTGPIGSRTIMDTSNRSSMPSSFPQNNGYMNPPYIPDNPSEIPSNSTSQNHIPCYDSYGRPYDPNPTSQYHYYRSGSTLEPPSVNSYHSIANSSYSSLPHQQNSYPSHHYSGSISASDESGLNRPYHSGASSSYSNQPYQQNSFLPHENNYSWNYNQYHDNHNNFHTNQDGEGGKREKDLLPQVKSSASSEPFHQSLLIDTHHNDNDSFGESGFTPINDLSPVNIRHDRQAAGRDEETVDGDMKKLLTVFIQKDES